MSRSFSVYTLTVSDCLFWRHDEFADVRWKCAQRRHSYCRGGGIRARLTGTLSASSLPGRPRRRL